jgi:hypothetical protein
MKAARSPPFEAGGKRRRAPAGAEGALAAHPQERQHSAAEGGTRERVRPAPKLSACGACAAPRQGSSPEWAETRMRSWP